MRQCVASGILFLSHKLLLRYRSFVLIFVVLTPITDCKYDGESNENIKSVIKILNKARLSCKLTAVIMIV